LRTLRNTSIVESGCLDPTLNIFYSKSSDGRMYVMRQPRRADIKEHRKAWKKVNPDNKHRFKRATHPPWLYNVKQRSRRPLYRGEVPGEMPLIVEVDGEVVGFSDAFFRYGEHFKRYEVPPDDVCSNFYLTALDGLQGMGIGTYYAKTSNAAARHFGCQWILGETYRAGGLHRIRQRDGWETLSVSDKFALHRKRL